MHFNLISNLSNGVGLEADYRMLRAELERRGHTVHGVQFNAPSLHSIPQADINIFLEVVESKLFPYASRQWAVPNPEWWFKGWDATKFEKILAKTHDCYQIFWPLGGSIVSYLGWQACDLFDATFPREPKFLHVAGKSMFKNTKAVMAASRQTGIPVLIVSQHFPPKKRIPQDELRRAMNTHQFHVMPSAYEGFGMVLHEAMGCGQILITTNAPPMNELEPVVLVPSAGSRPHHMGLLHTVKAEDIAAAMLYVKKLSRDHVQQMSEHVRDRFISNNREFQRNLNALVGSPVGAVV